MKNTPEYIKELLELYLRGELDSSKASEVAESIRTDPVWKNIHHELLIEQQGIRLNRLKLNRQSLLDLEATLANQEKKISSEGDLSLDPALTNTTFNSKGVEVNSSSYEMKEDYSIDKNTAKGIRYTSLRGQLHRLKEEEAAMAGSTLPKKNGAKVLGLKSYWWAVAAGVLLLVFGGYYYTELKKPKYVNQYLLDHFDEYVLHDKVRSSTPVDTFDRDKEIGYDLYVLKQFEKAMPYLERRWKNSNDSIALFYLFISASAIGDSEKLNSISYPLTLYSNNNLFINQLINNLNK